MKLDDLREDRSDLKRQVTVLATRLKKAIQKGLSNTATRNLFALVENAYLDFLDKDEEYRELVEADDTLGEKYTLVGGKNFAEYTAIVDNAYQEMKTLYDQHKKAKRKERGKEVESDSNTDDDADDEDKGGKEKEEPAKFEDAVEVPGDQQLDEEPAATTEGQGAPTQPKTPAVSSPQSPAQGSVPSASGNTSSTSTSPHGPSPQMFPGNYQFPNFNPSMYSPGYPFMMSSGTYPHTSQMPYNPAQVNLGSIPSPGVVPSQVVPPSSSGIPSISSAPYSYAGVPPFSSAPYSSAGFWPPNSAFMAPSSLYPMGIHQQVKVKAAELPRFSGLRKDWPEFKAIFPKLAVPAFPSPELRACELRNCIRGTHGKKTKAEELTEHISITGPQSYDDMWDCLTQYYDDEAAAVNSILGDISALKIVKSEDYQGLVDHVNRIEGCATQLSTLNRMGSLSMREVDNLACLLPGNVKRDWHKKYQSLPSADKILPFAAYVSFLKEERKSVVRLADQQQTQQTQVSSSRRNQVSSHYTKVKEGKHPKCAVHRTEGTKHNTESCQTFKQMDREEKIKILKEVNACFKCLGYHQRGKCQCRETCGECGRIGHKAVLCLTSSGHPSGKPNPPSQTASRTQDPLTSKSQHAQLKGKGIYAIYTVSVEGSKNKCCVFTDDGGDTSYITNKAARKYGAKKLNTYLLTVITTGNIETEYESTEYELNLITKSGKICTVQCFGLEKITGELSSLDPNIIKQIFPNYDSSLLLRKSKEVEIMLGTDYFGLHPKNEVCSDGENLSIMKGELGVCLQGSHPLLNADSSIDSNMVRVIKNAQLKVTTNSNLTVTSVKHTILETSMEDACKHQVQSHFTNAEYSKVQNFMQEEGLGTHIIPRGESCKGSECLLPGQEESEVKVIRDEGLQLHTEPDLKSDESYSSIPYGFTGSVRGRYFPNNHHATKLRMIQARKEVVHRSRDTTFNRFRPKFWIIQGSKVSSHQ